MDVPEAIVRLASSLNGKKSKDFFLDAMLTTNMGADPNNMSDQNSVEECLIRSVIPTESLDLYRT